MKVMKICTNAAIKTCKTFPLPKIKQIKQYLPCQHNKNMH